MTSDDCKKILAGYCVNNKYKVVKKWTATPPPPTDNEYNNFCKPKSWKRKYRRKNKDGDTVRCFISCCSIWYDKNDTGFPLMLRGTVTERNGKIYKISVRKW